MKSIAWVGIDPGARDTGIVLRFGPLCPRHTVIHNPAWTGEPSTVGAAYVAEVLAAVDEFIAASTVPVKVAVEGVSKPCPHLGITDPSAILGAAIVLGAVVGRWADAVVVPPGGNGSNLLRLYPAELVTPGERARGVNRPAGDSNLIRHCRSAWDVALAAPGVGRRSAALAKAVNR